MLYNGGSESGFMVEETEFGPSIAKLWGSENGYFYGYYVNNTKADGLLDCLCSGDSLYAFGFADLINWSDVYSYIDGEVVFAEDGSDIYKGKVCVVIFNENGEAEHMPLAGASVLMNGEVLDGLFSDENGEFSVPLLSSGEYNITVVSSDYVLIPPVCHFDFTVG